MGLVIKAQDDWPDLGRPQVAMHRFLPRFLVPSVMQLASASHSSMMKLHNVFSINIYLEMFMFKNQWDVQVLKRGAI